VGVVFGSHFQKKNKMRSLSTLILVNIPIIRNIYIYTYRKQSSPSLGVNFPVTHVTPISIYTVCIIGTTDVEFFAFVNI
jgi:hypothetical protein